MGMKFKFPWSRDKPGMENAAVSSAIEFYYGKSNAGVGVNPRTALNLSTVYACVRVIAETVASLPLEVMEVLPEGGTKKAIDHPLYGLLHYEPNPEMTSFSWRESLMTNLLLCGNAYSQIIRDGRGQIIGLYPLLSDSMRV